MLRIAVCDDSPTFLQFYSIEDKLTDSFGFFKCHRSYLVYMPNVDHFGSTQITMVGDLFEFLDKSLILFITTLPFHTLPPGSTPEMERDPPLLSTDAASTIQFSSFQR